VPESDDVVVILGTPELEKVSAAGLKFSNRLYKVTCEIIVACTVGKLIAILDLSTSDFARFGSRELDLLTVHPAYSLSRAENGNGWRHPIGN